MTATLHGIASGVFGIGLICTKCKEETTRIAEHCATSSHGAGVDYQLREMFESALIFGGEAIRMLGVGAEAAQEVIAGVREHDGKRFELQLAGKDWRETQRHLVGNAPEQAREGGVKVPTNAIAVTLANSEPLSNSPPA